jgi:kynurenine 3-monooxygenase
LSVKTGRGPLTDVAIIGAGLAGTLLAIILGRRGYRVSVFEKRPDPRLTPVETGRSINLALMRRGAYALETVDLLSAVLRHAVPVVGRAIHTADGRIVHQPLGRNSDDHIWAVPRHELQVELLEKAGQFPQLRFHFGCELEQIDLQTGRLQFGQDGHQRSFQADLIFAADGAASPVREEMIRTRRAAFQREKIDHGYKELRLDARFSGGYTPEHFHSWPRGSFMIFGNPNRDSSHTLTMFLPTAGASSFAELQDAEAVRAFFQEQFPDLHEASTSLVADFLANPTGKLGTVRGGPWHDRGRLLLIGDAAHAIVPFFGQGMNASFEDCTVLDSLLDRHSRSYEELFEAFYQSRRPNLDAIADLAMYNYAEIQSRVNDFAFRLRRAVEFELMKRYRDRYASMHVLVMFYRVPYAFARDCLTLQNQLLPQILAGASELDQIDWARAHTLLDHYTEDLDTLKRQHGLTSFSI